MSKKMKEKNENYSNQKKKKKAELNQAIYKKLYVLPGGHWRCSDLVVGERGSFSSL